MNSSNFFCLFLIFSSFFFLTLTHEVSAQQEKHIKPPSKPIVRAQFVTKNDSPIIGVAVIVDGTTKGIVSDANGFFELDLSQFTEKKVTLVFSHWEHARKTMEVVLKDLPKSYGQIKLADAAFKE